MEDLEPIVSIVAVLNAVDVFGDSVAQRQRIVAEAEDRIFKNFELISDGKTGIMISHRISSARMSNKIVVLDGGTITEQGTHDELIAFDGLYAKLYNLQREKYTVKEGD